MTPNCPLCTNDMTSLTWDVLADIVPDAVSVVHILPSEGTQVDSQGELVQVLDGLLDPEVVRGVGVVVEVRQLGGGQTSHTDDGTSYRTWK